MKEKIKQLLSLINLWKIILIIVLIGAGLFYWFQWRLSQIYSFCSEEAKEKAIIYNNEYSIKGIMEEFSIDSPEGAIIYLDEPFYYMTHYDSYYKQCLREKGINK